MHYFVTLHVGYLEILEFHSEIPRSSDFDAFHYTVSKKITLILPPISS